MRRVLLIDDDVRFLDILAARLTMDGYEVFKQPDGAQALETVAECRPDIILLDLNMPKVDGFMVKEQLGANPATEHIPVIFVSASDAVIDKVKGLQLGVDDYCAVK